MRKVLLVVAGAGLAASAATLVQAQSIPRTCVGGLCVGSSTPKPPKPPATPPVAPPKAEGGKLCVDEICLGDGLEALAGYDWKQALERYTPTPTPSAGRAVSGAESSRITRRYRGDFSAVSGYLVDEQFDAGALAGLAKVTSACEAHYLTGVYVSSGGNPTTVEIALRPAADDLTTQRWTVRAIMREIPSAGTSAQRDQAAAEVRARYGKGVVINSHHGGTFNFTMRLPPLMNESATLAQHPACGGNGGAKVSID